LEVIGGEEGSEEKEHLGVCENSQADCCSVISDMTEVTDVCAVQTVLLLQFFAIASQIVHDR